MKRRGPNKVWTAVDDLSIGLMLAAGFKHYTMAKRLGVRLCQVQGRMKKLGLRKKQGRRPGELKTRVKELHSQGLNDREIASEVGLATATVYYVRRKRLKLPSNISRSEASRRGGLAASDGSKLRRMVLLQLRNLGAL